MLRRSDNVMHSRSLLIVTCVDTKHVSRHRDVVDVPHDVFKELDYYHVSHFINFDVIDPFIHQLLRHLCKTHIQFHEKSNVRFLL